MRGAWTDAEHDAQEACALLSSPEPRPAVGAAYYRIGEIHRLRGEFQKAEEAYRQANQFGRKPQPGLALLRLAQGRIDIAASSIRSALAETEQRRTRARLLPVAVEIMVAAEDLETARTAETELCEIARSFGTPFLAAASAHVTGAVLLASGHAAEAMASLRRAWESWRELEMPYEQAQARVLIAAALLQLGDRDSRNIELDAARQLFKHLGAGPALRADLGTPRATRTETRRRAQRARSPGASPCRSGQNQPRHRRRAVHQRKDGRPARQQHLQ